MRRQEQVDRWRITVTSYRLGDRYYCTVDNVEPGARIARGEGPTRAEAERIAIEKVAARLAQTRVLG
ncbi:MAG: hypothetical protein ACREJ7_10050 [Candidatus Methylomirabilales bacterium]